MKTALQITTQNQLVPLNKGQNGLLGLIQRCISDGKPLSMEDIVMCYYMNIRKKYSDPWELREKEEDVLEAFRKKSFNWTYRIRGLVKSWFVNTIGTLVIKGKLIVLPVIEIED